MKFSFKLPLSAKLKEKFGETFSLVESRISALSRREKIMVAVMAAAFVIVVFGGGSLLIMDAIATAEEVVAEKTRSLSKINAQKAEFLAGKADLQRVEARLRRVERACKIFEFLEEEAKKRGIELADVKKIGVVGDQTAFILENHIEISIREITLDKLAEYLVSLERGPCMLKVVQLKVRARGPVNDRKLAVTFTSANYTLNPNIDKPPEPGKAPGAPASRKAGAPTMRKAGE